MIGYRRLSRRGFLGGAGVALALPFVESVVPRGARAQAAPRRFLGYYVPNGMRMEHWTPATEGAGYDLPPILAPLAPVQSRVSVITGLYNRPARPDGPGDHASGTGAFLTAAHPYKTEGADIRNGISLDQRLAGQLGAETSLPSLQLGIDGGGSAGVCDSGYSCAYARNISWASETTPLAKLTDPRTVFDRLFAGFDTQASQEDIQRRLRQDQSVLDYVLADVRALSPRLGTTDRRKLDEYMTGVRALETRLAGAASGPSCEPGGRPSADLPFVDHVKVMSDLMVLAFQCDVTRFTTFMLGNAGSNRSYAFIGASGAHHEISHHQGNSDNLNKLTLIDTWEIEQLVYLLQRMEAIDEGGQSMLDNTLVFFSSEIEDGDSHAHRNMPILLAGAAGGALSPGRHVVYADEPPVADLFLRILHSFGVMAATFGDDGSTPLEGV
jgi:hypothetical protein